MSNSKIPPTTNDPIDCIKAWKNILKVNWNAIFRPSLDALESLTHLAPVEVSKSLEQILDSVTKVQSAGLGTGMNIGSEIFPKIADDRRQSAAFYTQAHNAEFLAALTITEDMVECWADLNLFDNFKIADMACGTGSLLRFGYRLVRNLYEKHGGNNTNQLHVNAMEKGIYGVDVSPIAAHLTATGLAVDSNSPYNETNIGWVGVGDIGGVCDSKKLDRLKDEYEKVNNPSRKRDRKKIHDLERRRMVDSVKTGSIEYMKNAAVRNLLPDIGMPQYEFGKSVGKENDDKDDVEEHSVIIADHGFDVILMNPPYSRTHIGQSAFDIAGLTDFERMLCQEKWGNQISKEECNKTAGMAATFLCMAKNKIKNGGRVGFILPRTAASADTWEVTRSMFEKNFENKLAVVVEAGKALGEDAVSHDTRMEEMILIGTKKNEAQKHNADNRIKCVTLKEPILRLGEATEVARAVISSPDEDDGEVVLGTMIGIVRMFRPDNGRAWSPLGVVKDDVNSASNDMLDGQISAPDGTVVAKIEMTMVGELFKCGSSHDSIGHIRGNDTRGAFTFTPVRTNYRGKNRSMWSTNSMTQISMVVRPTHKGIPYVKPIDNKIAKKDRKRAVEIEKEKSAKRVKKISKEMTTLFYNKNVRWTSQKIVAAMTEFECVGGNGWVGLQHDNELILKAFALWANSTYGMMTYWAEGGRQQQGRSIMKVNALTKVRCPNFEKIDKKRLVNAAKKFDNFSKEALKSANQAYDDPVRCKINAAVSKLLGVPDGFDINALTKSWCFEPSIRTKPREQE